MPIILAKAKQMIYIRENIIATVHFLTEQPNFQFLSLRYPFYTYIYMQYAIVDTPSRLWLSYLIG